jgi:hypothetical protein
VKKKTICVLANSVKNHQSCIAGIEILKTGDMRWRKTGQWIRPISHRSNGAISDAESYLGDKDRNPNLFDIVEIPLEQQAHVEGHPEDWLIARRESWRYVGHFNPNKISHFLETPDDLWLEKNEKRDRVTGDFLVKHSLPSLYLVKPERLKLYVSEADFGDGPKRKRRACFRYGGVDYDMAMTDRTVNAKYFIDYNTRPAGLASGISLQTAGICVSLTPSWKAEHLERGYHYKLVAAIIELE